MLRSLRQAVVALRDRILAGRERERQNAAALYRLAQRRITELESQLAALQAQADRSQAAHRGFFELYDHEALSNHCKLLFRVVAAQQREAIVDLKPGPERPVYGVQVNGWGRGL